MSTEKKQFKENKAVLKRGPGPQEASLLSKRAETVFKQLKVLPRGLSLSQSRQSSWNINKYRIEFERQNEKLLKVYNELADSGRRYYELYEYAPTGFIDIDKKGRIKEINLRACQLLGVNRDRAVRLNFSYFVAKESRTAYREFLKKIFKTRQMQSHELVVRCVKKKKFYSLIKSIPVDANGKTSLIRLALIEINDLKKTEQALGSQRQELQSILDNVPAWIFYKDKKNRFIRVNNAFALAMGIKKRDLEGKPMSDLYPEEQAEAFWLDDKEVISTGRPKLNIVEPVTTKEGIRLVQTGKVPYRNEKGDIIGIVGFTIDITERKKAEQELRNREVWLSATMNSVGDGLIATDNNGSVVFLNPVAQVMTGWAQIDAKGKHIDQVFKIISEETGKEVENPVDKVMREGRKTGMGNHTILVARNGRKTPVEDSAAPIRDSKGEIIGVIMVFRDASRRKGIEKRLQETIKLKTDFTNLVSHEMRTPLAAIKESVYLTLETIAGQNNSVAESFLSITKNNIDRLSKFVNDVLDFQKLESGMMEFVRQEHNINDVIVEVRDTMMPLADNKGLEINLKLDNSLPDIAFDRDKIIEVLMNLMNNSLKFTEKGGIAISSEKKDNIVMVTVNDTGPGVKEEDLPKLFKYYGQIERRSGSTGLGLVICRDIINAHGGKMWAESKPGEGLTVHFVLPIKDRRKA